MRVMHETAEKKKEKESDFGLSTQSWIRVEIKEQV